ncbi:hypothetical protein LIP73_09270 [Dorea longicatena]|uniref:hypothetical protein n=1 Tax=Dorea longicatena TaxID=88431 RepID=UPI001D0339ED|nr:hypothetical protein [Dorea longicatena]MCB5536407.1 hypothetical protein [bacterium MSK17_88]MCB5546995.1 hypothetical protein [Dorea longicatena]MCG4574847.1 hypothetical protein [Dorea longicatena]
MDKTKKEVKSTLISMLVTGGVSRVVKIFKSEILLGILFFIFLVYLCVNMTLLILDWQKAKKRKGSLYDAMMEEAYKDEDKQKKVGFHTNILCDGYQKKRQCIFREYGKNICGGIVMAIVVCAFNMSTVKALERNVKVCIGIEQDTVGTETAQKHDITSEDKSEDKNETEKKKMDVSGNLEKQKKQKNQTKNKEKGVNATDNIRRRKPEEYRFILKNVKTDNLEDSEEIQYVMSINNPLEWIERQKDTRVNNPQFKEVENKLKKNYSDYMIDENSFENEIQACKEILYMDEWKERAPVSEKLDMLIIGKRKLLREMEKQQKENYEIWWSLANNYQDYAIEYSNQTKKAEKITYFYMESIYCCLMALEFDNTKETDEMITNYMKARYKDLVVEDGTVHDYRIFALDVLEVF